MLHRLLPLLCWLLVLSATPGAAAEPAPLPVRYLQQPEDAVRYTYEYRLIAELMARTEARFGSYQLQPYTGKMSSRRLNNEAIRGERINLMWSDAGHPDLDSQMIRIPFPLLKGLLGYRIFLIRKADQPRFAAIRNLEELKQLRLGQGANWGDIKIYRHNGFAVTTGGNYQNLFHMLVSGRFDYFPRGAPASNPVADLLPWRRQPRRLAILFLMLLLFLCPKVPPCRLPILPSPPSCWRTCCVWVTTSQRPSSSRRSRSFWPARIRWPVLRPAPARRRPLCCRSCNGY